MEDFTLTYTELTLKLTALYLLFMFRLWEVFLMVDPHNKHDKNPAAHESKPRPPVDREYSFLSKCR